MLGACLRRARLHLGISTRGLAKAADLAPSQISRIESGKFDCMISSYVRICGALGLSFCDLLDRSVLIDYDIYRLAVTAQLHKCVPAGFEKDQGSLEAFTALAVGACIAFSSIIRSANPKRCAKELFYPAPDVESRFVEVAEEVEINPLSMTARVDLFNGLQSYPVTSLLEVFDFPKPEHVKAHLLRAHNSDSSGGGIWVPRGLSEHIEVWDDLAPFIKYQQSLKKPDCEKQGMLDNSLKLSDNNSVKILNEEIRSLPELIKKIQQLTKDRGLKSALAREMGVSRQAVAEWLSGDSKPSPEKVFELLKWVKKARSFKQIKSPDRS